MFGKSKVPDIVRTHFHWCASNASPVSPSNPSELPKNFDDSRNSDSGPLNEREKKLLPNNVKVLLLVLLLVLPVFCSYQLFKSLC